MAANWDKIHVEGPIYVGGMTKIEDGATIIGPAMIGPSCHICEGATVDNSIIFDYSRIGPGVRLVEKLVFGRYCVDRNGDHFDLQEAALDWLITDARRQDYAKPSPQQKAMADSSAPTWRSATRAEASPLQDQRDALFRLHRHQVHSLAGLGVTADLLGGDRDAFIGGIARRGEAINDRLRDAGAGNDPIDEGGVLADFSRNTPAKTGSPRGAVISSTKRFRQSSSITIWVWIKRAPAFCLRRIRLLRPLQLGLCGSAAAPAKRSVGPSGSGPSTGSSPRLKAATCCSRRTDSRSFTGLAWG